MKLHENIDMFDQLIEATSSILFKDRTIIEKDYFATMFLKGIANKRNDIIFKGGTSLSKCFKVIDRFSEDIDLTVDMENGKPTTTERRALKDDVLSVIEENACFNLINPDQIKTRQNINGYRLEYPRFRDSGYELLNDHLKVEVAIMIRSYPTELAYANCLIYDFLIKNGLNELIAEYDLEPFAIRVQTKERTFIDKVFAIVDYYLSDRTYRLSRHIYDLYKLYPHMIFNNDFKTTVYEVRELRKESSLCLSAQDGIDINKYLQIIIDDSFYESDYKAITEKLLGEMVLYGQAIIVLDRIIKDGYFAA